MAREPIGWRRIKKANEATRGCWLWLRIIFFKHPVISFTMGKKPQEWPRGLRVQGNVFLVFGSGRYL